MSARVRRSQQAPQPGSARSPASGRRSPLKSPGSFHSPTRNLAPIGESASSPNIGASPGPGGRTRPRAGRRSTQKMDITAHQKSDHPLGSGGSGWNEQPKYQTPGQLWHGRWETMQPHPSFDVDGDGVISNLDYYLAKQFDRDNNGVLDQDEIVEMRKVLTKKGTEAFHAMGHGPHVKSLAAKAHSSLFDQTPRDMDPAKSIDPHSEQWHLQMKHLENKTAAQSGMSSHVVKKCVEHADTEAGQINMMDEMVGQGVHQMMGSGWKSDQDGHQDVYDASAGCVLIPFCSLSDRFLLTCCSLLRDRGWVDKKSAPKEVRDQDQDFVKDKKGHYQRRDNAILDGYMDQDEIEDSAGLRMMQAGNRMMEEEAILHNYQTPTKPLRSSRLSGRSNCQSSSEHLPPLPPSISAQHDLSSVGCVWFLCAPALRVRVCACVRLCVRVCAALTTLRCGCFRSRIAPSWHCTALKKNQAVCTLSHSHSILALP